MQCHFLDIPSIETTPNRRSISPRDEMLKQPDEQKEITRPGAKPKDDHRQPTDKDSPVKVRLLRSFDTTPQLSCLAALYTMRCYCIPRCRMKSY